MSTFLYFYFEIFKKSAVFLTKMFTKCLKNFRWMNTRVGEGFFEEKMANLKVFIAKVCENLTRVWRYYKHFVKHACDISLILLEPCNFLYKWRRIFVRNRVGSILNLQIHHVNLYVIKLPHSRDVVMESNIVNHLKMINQN